ncbi:MAG: hypothetical protein QOG96_964, partial [Pseudonocardiales bacterium]|nr:hypothetical protein [Pseudonocardiales bacterium]
GQVLGRPGRDSHLYSAARERGGH